jgi:hypothetical protein
MHDSVEQGHIQQDHHTGKDQSGEAGFHFPEKSGKDKKIASGSFVLPGI